MVEVDEAPKREREVSMGDAGCVKRDEESRRTFDHHPLNGTVLFSLLFLCVLFSFLFSFICCPLLSRAASDKEGGRTKRRRATR